MSAPDDHSACACATPFGAASPPCPSHGDTVVVEFGGVTYRIPRTTIEAVRFLIAADDLGACDAFAAPAHNPGARVVATGGGR